MCGYEGAGTSSDHANHLIQITIEGGAQAKGKMSLAKWHKMKGHSGEEMIDCEDRGWAVSDEEGKRALGKVK